MKSPTFGLLVLGMCYCLSSRPTVADDLVTDTWQVGPNCSGVVSTSQHICDFIRTQVFFPGDGTAYDQWNLIVVEAGPVVSVSCQTTGSNEFHYKQGHQASKPQTVPGDHYGNVGVCRGWINGGNAPVSITAQYQKPRAASKH